MSKALVVITLLLGAGFLAWRSCRHCQPKQPPQMDLQEWWGPSHLKDKQDTSVRPFKITFSPEMVSDLKDRLARRRKLTPPLEGVGFEYGFNTVYLEKVLHYWQNSYDFPKRQEFLNQFPQFKTNVQGLDIHFIRVKPEVGKNTKVVPLLLMHGWPGSVREFYEMIPMLTKQRPGHDFVFEVIAPSLPGYGFSDGAVRPDLAATQIGVVMRNLMHRLGHKTFYVQGGDWGAAVAAAMATIFPNEVLGHHTNMAFIQSSCATIKTIVGSLFPTWFVDEELVDRMYPLSQFFSTIIEEMGYAHIQATKPDTVSVGLMDSPAGLAAYILEKFSTWTKLEYKKLPDGGITKIFTLDQLIDNLMIYWTSSSITTSMRLYAEEMSSKGRALDMGSIPTPVPTWALQAKYELGYQPPSLLKEKFVNLLGTTVLHGGGHFMAFEKPAILADDIFKAVKTFIEWHETTNKERKTEL